MRWVKIASLIIMLVLLPVISQAADYSQPYLSIFKSEFTERVVNFLSNCVRYKIEAVDAKREERSLTSDYIEEIARIQKKVASCI